MRTQILALFVFAATSVMAADGDIIPFEPEKPVLQIFEPKMKKLESSEFTFDDKQPLLTVYTIRELRLAKDDKGVMLCLNQDGTKALEELTRKYEGAWLVMKGGDGPAQMIPVSKAISDGHIGFKYPESAQIAEYLRRRFRIAEFKQ